MIDLLSAVMRLDFAPALFSRSVSHSSGSLPVGPALCTAAAAIQNSIHPGGWAAQHTLACPGADQLYLYIGAEHRGPPQHDRWRRCPEGRLQAARPEGVHYQSLRPQQLKPRRRVARVTTLKCVPNMQTGSADGSWAAGGNAGLHARAEQPERQARPIAAWGNIIDER